jgi:DNA invertase Pin-like site-specific DNA recombinase
MPILWPWRGRTADPTHTIPYRPDGNFLHLAHFARRSPSSRHWLPGPTVECKAIQTISESHALALSGKTLQRPELDALLVFVRESDTVVVASMDRLARNLDDLRRLVQQLTARGVKVAFLKEHLTFTGEDSPMAQLLLSVMGAFAEFERALIHERQREGIALAKMRGAYRGRKPTLSAAQVAQLSARVEAGEAKSRLAREFGISRETLYQYLKRPV